MVDERVCGFVDCGGKMGAYPLLRVWPEIKYLFQGGMCGKGSLLSVLSRLLGTSFAWWNLFWAYLIVVTSFYTLCSSQTWGMPHLHVEGIGALLLHDWSPHIYGGLQLRDRGPVPGAGKALTTPSGSPGLLPFCWTLPGFLSQPTPLQ